MKLFIVLLLAFANAICFAHPVEQTKGSFVDKFRQLDEKLPTPNRYRSATGEPTALYWQQQVDYDIKVRLNEKKRRISAVESITYTNNSPNTLKYLWMQLDQNRFKKDSIANLADNFGGLGRRGAKTTVPTSKKHAKISIAELRRNQFFEDNEVGFNIVSVVSDGKPLTTTIVGTLMRIDLPKPLKPKAKFNFEVAFNFNIVEENAVWARSGYEHFPDDARKGGNDIFLLAQWFPRLVAFSDFEGWHNKEFIGRGEFTLEFGDYNVEITVPKDHIVSSTGELTNSNQVLSATQIKRLETAKTADDPVFIVTAEEALKNESSVVKGTKTWKFSAKNVRDFAFASSRKFIWDAQGYSQDSVDMPVVMAMSFYPKEGGDLWKKYSTASVIHTMKVYSRFTFDYPYPTAQSVNGPVGGMEYPMITFNGPRTILQKDGSRTYTLAEKRFLIGVVIHEIGHIYFPMLVNSDERQWTWMDEGLNSFLDAVACLEWDPDMPWNVEPKHIVDYMQSTNQVPIMTQSDSVLNLGPNAYSKPTAALFILREVIMGRQLFDFAFKEYANRWYMKRPTPADFFRTMEEASGVDLDWFWHGWFYTTDHVDIAIDNVIQMNLNTYDADVEFGFKRKLQQDKPISIFEVENNIQKMQTWVELNPKIRDFYDDNDQYTVTNVERNKNNKIVAEMKPLERKAFKRALKANKNYYLLQFSNKGGLVMPIVLRLEFEGNYSKKYTIPAEIWRRDHRKVNHLVITKRKLKQVVVDPNEYTADVAINNNYFPRRIQQSRLDAYKAKKRTRLIDRDTMHGDTIKLKAVKNKQWKK